ncbi:hypothetical protein IL306_013405, partial [Fusarium sp. DS 682]
RDAGKEILYQVTQQAFNELLDTIFKPAEDLAVQAGETKDQRAKYKDVLDTIEPGDDDKSKPTSEGDSKVRSAADKTLEELLSETGYTIALPEGRNAVEIDTTVEIIHEDGTAQPVSQSGTEVTMPVSQSEDQDPTLPQFRPDTPEGTVTSSDHIFYPITQPSSDTPEGDLPQEEDDTESAPTSDTLRHWKRLSLAEAQAIKRGGWGKLSFDEFEAIYKSQEHQGNRLDYLGSWIDFCIP